MIIDGSWSTELNCWTIQFLTENQKLIKTLENRCEAFSSSDQLLHPYAVVEDEEDEDEGHYDPYTEEAMARLNLLHPPQELWEDADDYTQSHTKGWFYVDD